MILDDSKEIHDFKSHRNRNDKNSYPLKEGFPSYKWQIPDFLNTTYFICFCMIWNLPRARTVYRHATLVSSLLSIFLFHWEAIYCFRFVVFSLCPYRAGRFHTQQCYLWYIQKHKYPLGYFQIFLKKFFYCFPKYLSGLKWANFIWITTFQMIFIAMKITTFSRIYKESLWSSKSLVPDGRHSFSPLNSEAVHFTTLWKMVLPFICLFHSVWNYTKDLTPGFTNNIHHE